MILILHELKTTLDHAMNRNFRVGQLTHFKPHLIRYASPAGSVKVQLLEDDQVVAESASRAIAGIGEGTYWHGYVVFQLSAHLKANTRYVFRLAAADYEFSESAYLGWCNAFDLSKYRAGVDLSVGVNAPLDVETYSWQRQIKGVS